jgi:two-component system, chemotaxis family, protein-glutamate methylesterase/glutaminase
VPCRDIVVIGASAGGVEALKRLIGGLPSDFRGSLFITVHFPEHGTSVLPSILSRAGRLGIVHAVNGESIVPGRAYVAPPDHHLLLTRSGVKLIRGPRENGNRPAIDPMFRSAALAFGPRVIGVVLTGNLDDGTAGLAAIKRAGGLTLVQDPADALFPSMPQSALDHVEIDCVAPIRSMTAAIARLMATPIQTDEHSDMQGDVNENALSAVDLREIASPDQHAGATSPYSCPDCGGVLWEIEDGNFVRFRCRVGHAWTGDALVEKQETVLDDALWTALRSLEENIALSRHLAKKQRDRGSELLAARFEAQAAATEEKASIIRRALVEEAAPAARANAI